jgi:transposase
MVSPQVFRVDEFALRKRHTYGTLLLDLERRRLLALLPTWEAAPVAQWLQAQPGVEVYVRDRAEAYAEAARTGAPTACQAADRLHLLQHLADVLTQVCIAHPTQLAQLHAQRAAEPTPVHDPAYLAEAAAQPSIPLAPPQASRAAARLARQRRTRRWTHDHQVWLYHQQGWPLEALAQQVGLSRRTVQRYLQCSTYPERQPRHDRDRSLLAPYNPALLAGWNHGCRNGAHLFARSAATGFGVGMALSPCTSDGCAGCRGSRRGHAAASSLYQR